MILEEMMKILQGRLGEDINKFLLPPPVFTTMGGEFLSMDLESGLLATRFPVEAAYLNPYGAVQGGIVTVAVDNTLGPLSMLVAPPNVTRRLEMKFSRAVTPSMGTITVEARFLGQEGRRLKFSAEVRGPEGVLCARARATHWILDDK
jgi:acyl-coenzyme A thioesterase PaaI-like protein